ncbi:MAG TPA: malto-oligosyltrehalose synthase [Jatrophihabitantaceae bacterium]|jgi:(1->4)-alpha-D-glucan 1-alpha-D-glucosylmutase|nr:malto-oligosyltrehalose synthase [Jatrophihabitantaceae bacterium]
MPAVPTSTYRLQIRRDFDLSAATAALDYLVALGAGAVYLSPLLQAVRGSDHGYDVVDHSRVDAERGGPQALAELVEEAHERGLGVVVDIVPNHMGVADATQNAPWWDVLRLGRESQHASWFDIDWDQGRLLLPVLGLEAEPQISVTNEVLRYHDRTFPLAPDTPSGSVAEVRAAQHYELAPYPAADVRQNYRRFFAITELAGLCVEDRAVFDATHVEIRRWVTELGIDGLRVDHPDGLRDPQGYLTWLRELAPHAWLTVEKITKRGERLPADWPVDGMTGYDALADVTEAFVDPAGQAGFDAVQLELTGDDRGWPAHAADGKRLIATTLLRAEALRLGRLAGVHGGTAALTELAVHFPVYRSYVPDGTDHLDQAVAALAPQDRTVIESLLSRLRDPHDELALRFQQFSSAVMAKGVEDTAYYRYNRLGALTEVGGDPAMFGAPVARFHAAAAERLAHAPRGMTTLSTHDTKRSEDVRAFQIVLTEVHDLWAAALRTLQGRAPLPDPALAALLWQTFVGTSRPGLIARERMHAYLEKAMREAAAATTWREPDADFEKAVHAAVDAAYDDPDVCAILRRLIERVLPAAFVVALGQKLVQLTMPGVPDVYQGTELWDDSLVDPDNRRAVDLGLRARLLAELDAAGPPPLDASGRAKLWVTSRALRLRRDNPEWFGGYRPVLARGAAVEHLLGFDRGGAVTLVTRLPLGLETSGGWRDTTVDLPDGRFVDALTGVEHAGTVDLGRLLATYPVALLRPSSAD